MVGGVAKRGTRDNVECSNRGICQQGQCRCYFGFASSDGGGGEVKPGPGGRLDCGYLAATSVTDCPASCYGRGVCSGPPEWTCSCYGALPQAPSVSVSALCLRVCVCVCVRARSHGTFCFSPLCSALRRPRV